MASTELKRLPRVVVAVAALWPFGALAGSVSTEVTAGRGYLALNVTGDIELRPDETFLTLCYGMARSPPIQSQTSALPPVTPRPAHLLCAGVDHALSPHWIGSVLFQLSPTATQRIALTEGNAILTGRSSAGAAVAVAYESAGFSDAEFGVDASVAVTGYRLLRALETPNRRFSAGESLGTLRPSVGALLVLAADTELSLRAGYSLYSKDPLTAGRFTDEQLAGIERLLLLQAWEAGRLAEALRNLELLEGRILQADAVTGFPSAPVWLDLRVSASHRFNRVVRGQLSYAFERYVPTQGYGHVLSTKWSFRVADSFRLWTVLALQRDEPLDHPERRTAEDPLPETSGLLTLGAEVSF